MKLLEKILVPVDFGNYAEGQLNLAIDLAGKFNSEIYLLHVLPLEAKSESIREIVENAIDTEFDKLVAKVDTGDVNLQRKVLYGNVFEQVLTYSEDENVNLILAGADSAKKNRKTGIGSITDKLVRKSQKPVWVVNDCCSPVMNKILCPVDFSDASKRALDNAIKIARSFNSRLYILNVFETLEYSFSTRLEIDYDAENARLNKENDEKLSKFLKESNLVGLDHEIIGKQGDPTKAILDFVKKENIGLVFIGSTGKSMLGRLLVGSVAEHTIRELDCSFVTTKSTNILNLKVDSEISNIEKHFKQAKELEKAGYFKEAIEQYEICLNINDMHIPAFSGLIKLHEKLGDNDKAAMYEKMLSQIFRRLWDARIEDEIRRHYFFK